LPLAQRLWVLQVYEAGVRDFVARVHENVKKTYNHRFTGLVVVARCSCASLERFQSVCSPSSSARRGAQAKQSQAKKTVKI